MIAIGIRIGPAAVSPIDRKPWTRSPGRATSSRIWNAAVTREVGSRTRGDRRAAGRDLATGPGDPANSLVDLVRGRVTVGESNVVPGMTGVRPSEKSAPGDDRDAELAGPAGNLIPVGIVR